MSTLQRLLNGEVKVAWLGSAPGSNRGRLVFPGSFNPMHHGHLRMSKIAKEQLGVLPDLEISIENVDKPNIDALAIEERVQQCLDREQFKTATIWLTRAPTFFEKSELFPNATFIIGADTFVRLFDDQYYADSNQCFEELKVIQERGCKFMVFGRKVGGRFQAAPDLSVTRDFQQVSDMFDWISETEFREDVSSSQIRGDENSV